jgi:hypothetical protein
MVFELNLIAVRLVQGEAIIEILQLYHDASSGTHEGVITLFPSEYVI